MTIEAGNVHPHGKVINVPFNDLPDLVTMGSLMVVKRQKNPGAGQITHIFTRAGAVVDISCHDLISNVKYYTSYNIGKDPSRQSSERRFLKVYGVMEKGVVYLEMAGFDLMDIGFCTVAGYRNTSGVSKKKQRKELNVQCPM